MNKNRHSATRYLDAQWLCWLGNTLYVITTVALLYSDNAVAADGVFASKLQVKSHSGISLHQLNSVAAAVGSEGFLEAHLFNRSPGDYKSLSCAWKERLLQSERVKDRITGYSGDIGLEAETRLLVDIQSRLLGCLLESTSCKTRAEKLEQLQKAKGVLSAIKNIDSSRASTVSTSLTDLVEANCYIAQHQERLIDVPIAVLQLEESLDEHGSDVAGALEILKRDWDVKRFDRDRDFQSAKRHDALLRFVSYRLWVASRRDSTLINYSRDAAKAVGVTYIAAKRELIAGSRPNPYAERARRKSIEDLKRVHEAHKELKNALLNPTETRGQDDAGNPELHARDPRTRRITRENKVTYDIWSGPNPYLTCSQVERITKPYCGNPTWYFFLFQPLTQQGTTLVIRRSDFSDAETGDKGNASEAVEEANGSTAPKNMAEVFLDQFDGELAEVKDLISP